MKKQLFFAVSILIILAFITFCDNKNTSFSVYTWTSSINSPILSYHPGEGYQWNDPSVLKSGDDYIMYLARNKTAFDFGNEVLPYRAVSTNGKDWTPGSTPLIETGAASEFDEKSCETPSVVYFNGTYHMYYTGVSSAGLSGTLEIGHATSSDGTTWTKDDANNPVLSPTGTSTDWNGDQVAEPGAVVYNNDIYLYFTAVGQRSGPGPAAQRTIGLAISSDGAAFGAQTQVLTQGPLYPATSDFEGYSAPCAFVNDGDVHLFYDAAKNDGTFVRLYIHHASSSDGTTFTEDAVSHIFANTSFTWTAREIRSPSVINDNRILKMWFAGDDFNNAPSTWGIGYAETYIDIY